MMEFLREQIAVNLALQHASGLETIFRILSFLGNEEFFLLLIPFFYLCVSPRIGVRLALLVLCGDALNNLLKLAFHLPRPYWLDPRVRAFSVEASFGLPSSHAQNAATVWSFLAAHSTRRAVAWLAAAVLILLISLARIYLGVHFLGDVLAGWILGALLLWSFYRFEPTLRTRWLAANFMTQIGSAFFSALLLVALGLIGFYAARDINQSAAAIGLQAIVARAGALAGLGIGCAFMWRYARFSVSGVWWRRAVSLVATLLVLLVLWKGLAAIFPRAPQGEAHSAELIFRFVRYGLMTFWVSFLAPLWFLKIGWMERAAQTLKADG